MKIITADELSDEYYSDTIIDDIDVVNDIIDDVRKRGDFAVRKYTAKFDNLDLDNYEINSAQIRAAYESVNKTQIKALKRAATNIRKFAELQFSMFTDVESKDMGYRVGHKVIPIEKVGCYVPGGIYPLPSTALMTVIPAKVAGVSDIVVCSPKIAPETVVAADIAGADRIFQIGGAQAVAAMAFGTDTIPRVDKIVGPGNKYVTAAKKRVYGVVGIDFLAGPSEVMIIADDTADAEIVAADLLAQAEHDTMARSDLITTSRSLAEEVYNELERQLNLLDTKEIAAPAIEKTRLIIVNSLDEAVKICNKRAPEHLELQIKNKDEILERLFNYGSLFIGSYSAEVFGDYCSGPNHTLPTNRVARFTGGLSVKEYIKIVSYQELNGSSLPELISTSSTIAKMEGLHAHQRAAEIREKLLK